MMNLIEQLKEHEGFRCNYYYCTAEKKTIGYGRNVESNPFTPKEMLMLGRKDFDNDPMTEEEAEQLLVNDVNRVTASVKEYFPWAELNPSRKAVLVNMAINMGITGLLKFKKMKHAILLKRYEQAGVEMMLSLWAEQVGGRAEQLSLQMYAGQWVETDKYIRGSYNNVTR
ncbi:MAG TPA: glycoside hydrolase [Flavobacteriales bacterium]|nr:glycoside hydrolase [Flavobacteriales bacterium]